LYIITSSQPNLFLKPTGPFHAAQQNPSQLYAVSQNSVANHTECSQACPVYKARPVTVQSVAGFRVSQIMYQRALSGQTHADNYICNIFDDLVPPGYGYDVNFYSGFVSVFGIILLLILVERIPRMALLIPNLMLTPLAMWTMALAFYYNWVGLAVAANLVYCFTLYFGMNGIVYVYLNEISEPFMVGIGFAFSWGLRELFA
jgi:hypothetical protein